jgi:hypothetical protein
MSLDGVLRTALSAGLSIVSTRIMLSAPLIKASSSGVNPSPTLLQAIKHSSSSVFGKLLNIMVLTV